MRGGVERGEPGREKIRVFIALNVPSEWKQQLREVQNRLQTELKESAIKWVDPEQIHITLRFLGWIQAEEVEIAKEALSAAAAVVNPFAVTSGTLGCFPSSRRPRVIWVGIVDEAQSVIQLQKEVTERTRKIGEPPEDREFKAHLTIGRVKAIDRAEASVLAEALEKRFELAPEWRVSELVLMRSRLSPAGARYEELHTARLGRR